MNSDSAVDSTILNYDRLFIDGDWVRPSSSRVIEVVSSNTGEVIGRVPEAQMADIDRAVGAARRALDDPVGWAHWAPARRAAIMDAIAEAIEDRAEEIGRRVSAQNGMPIAISQPVEGGFSARVFRYMASLARDLEVEVERPHLLNGTSIVRREPIGVVAAIVPWNYPQALAAYKLGPALAAGCTVVLKPSPETVLDAMVLAEILMECDLPPGVISIVPGGRKIGAYLVEHPNVDKVAFTGSTAAGRRIAEVCGRMLRPVTLELGGKSAAVVLDDANLDFDIIGRDFFDATLINNGQTCYLSTRILAPRSRYDEVVSAVATFVRSMIVGDALDPTTQIGPMATSAHRDRVENYIATGRREGARLVVGGARPKEHDRGWFVEPTVFADVDNRATIAREEIFGPVLCVIPYDGDEDAIRIANDSDYGLGGSVWTTDPARGRMIAKKIQTGTIGINRYFIDPASPFGGVKASGMGHELGPNALDPYLSYQTIYT